MVKPGRWDQFRTIHLGEDWHLEVYERRRLKRDAATFDVRLYHLNGALADVDEEMPLAEFLARTKAGNAHA